MIHACRFLAAAVHHHLGELADMGAFDGLAEIAPDMPAIRTRMA
ncbi:hypothetical protein [Thermoactinospora rubra]|nr:hypothetical protein [Thermoactinospora rubra]